MEKYREKDGKFMSCQYRIAVQYCKFEFMFTYASELIWRSYISSYDDFNECASKVFWRSGISHHFQAPLMILAAISYCHQNKENCREKTSLKKRDKNLFKRPLNIKLFENSDQCQLREIGTPKVLDIRMSNEYISYIMINSDHMRQEDKCPLNLSTG